MEKRDRTVFQFASRDDKFFFRLFASTCMIIIPFGLKKPFLRY